MHLSPTEDKDCTYQSYGYYVLTLCAGWFFTIFHIPQKGHRIMAKCEWKQIPMWGTYYYVYENLGHRYHYIVKLNYEDL
jgi:hypothetical protein